MVVLRYLLAPILFLKWISDPHWSFRLGGGFAKARPPASARDPVLPAGRAVSNGTLLRRRKLRLLAFAWLAGAALIGGLMVGLMLSGEMDGAGTDGWILVTALTLLGTAPFLFLGLWPLRFLRLARRSRDLKIVYERDAVSKRREFGVLVEISPRLQGSDDVEVGLACRRQWVRRAGYKPWEAALWFARDRALWEHWEPVPAPAPASAHLTFVVPAAQPVSEEEADDNVGDPEASVYWRVSARTRRRRGLRRPRTDVPIWVGKAR